MSNSLEVLLVELVDVTLQLEQIVMNPDSDPEAWLTILEHRQTLFNELDCLLAQLGTGIPEELKKKYVTEILSINQKLIPVIQEKLSVLESKIKQQQKRKLMASQYEGSDYMPFGAFFDKKK